MSQQRALVVLERLDLPRLFTNSINIREPNYNYIENIQRRKNGIDIHQVEKLWYEWKNKKNKMTNENILSLIHGAMRLPNQSHIASWACHDKPIQLSIHGKQPKLSTFKEFHYLCEPKHLIRTSNLGNLGGKRSFVLLGPLAELEQALIRFTLDKLREANFELISVPDILYSHVLEGCGMPTTGERNQVYLVEMAGIKHDEMLCLSGTGEMGIGGLLQDKILDLDKPLKLVCVSRCYRSETSTSEDEKGIYRVHGFTKIEMFGVTKNDHNKLYESEKLHEEFKLIQENLYSECELYFRTLEMPLNELGNAAYRKYDIEAWMPGRGMWGEISSTSNCTDYQSRRLNIRYRDTNNLLQFAHTVNGTGCAIPRMLIAMIEMGQQSDESLTIPWAIEKYMKDNWKNTIKKYKPITYTFLRKNIQQEKITQLFNPYVW